MVLTFPLPAGTVVKGPGGQVWFAMEHDPAPDDDDDDAQLVFSIKGFDMGGVSSRIVKDLLDKDMTLLRANARVTELTEEADLPAITNAYKRWRMFKKHDARSPAYILFSTQAIPAFLQRYPQIGAHEENRAAAFSDQ